MKFSLITPSHRLTYINELYQSIKNQTYENWEWILYLNGKAVEEQHTILEDIRNDDKVRILIDESGNSNVGYLKHKAFNEGTGDVLVEMDHDDLIVPECLEKLKIAFQDAEVGFVYSNNAKLPMNRSFTPYNPAYGWTYEMFNWKGQELFNMHSFEPSAASMAFIWYMPDHVRAWRKSVYKSIGGHDTSLSVLDDQDLIVRTYLNTKFKFIQEVLYIYRITGDNTWLERNKLIQTGTVEMFNKYAYALAERDADLNGLLKVDIGGGIDGRNGYMTIDLEDADIRCDLNDGIPLDNNSVGVINASHTLEHLKNPINSMSEIYRVLADGGWAMIEVPSTDGRGAWQDPTHCCYSDDTEVLTRCGWKLFKDVTYNDYVITMNPLTELCEYQQVSQIHSYHYNDNMIEFRNRSTNMLVTPNHNMLYRSSGKKGKWNFRTSESLLGQSNKSVCFCNKVTLDISNCYDLDHITLPKMGHVNGWSYDTTFDSIQLMKLLGWYISEGNVHIESNDIIHRGKRNTYRIDIHQSRSANPDNYNEIVELVSNMGMKPIQRANTITFCNKGLALWFNTLGSSSADKFIPQWIKECSPRLLKNLLDSAVKGDGTPNGKGYTYATISKQLANDISEIAQLIGYRATQSLEKRGYERVICNNKRPSFCNDIYLIYISDKSYQYCSAREVPYDGYVYCVGVDKYHTLYVRRNGRASWSGNSYWNENSFLYYTNRNQARYIRNNSIKFQEFRCETRYPSIWWKNKQIPVVTAWLRAIKSEKRRPHLINI